MTIAKADLIEGMAKGMAVLESFDTERQRLNATLAAQRAGITRASARRHLLTLTHLGYLETDGSYFWLSAKVLRFSGSYLSSARLPRLLQPTLSRLTALTAGDPVSAVVLDGHEVVIVARSGIDLRVSAASASGVLAYGLHLGARLPAHVTSTGRVLLAALPKTRSEFNRLAERRRGARALAAADGAHRDRAAALRAIIDQVRTDDWCMAHEEHEIGVHALAVPVRNMQGRTVAAMNVVTSPQRLAPAVAQRELLPALLEAARELRPLL
jgi:IclR family pca regulon transcriptional regulator